MTESKMLELAEQLLEQSKAGKVNWEEMPGSTIFSDFYSTSYKVSFPDISLKISRNSGAEYSLLLLDESGNSLDTLQGRRGSEEYKMLQEIYNLARREALSIEQNIDKALNYLKGQ